MNSEKVHLTEIANKIVVTRDLGEYEGTITEEKLAMRAKLQLERKHILHYLFIRSSY